MFVRTSMMCRWNVKYRFRSKWLSFLHELSVCASLRLKIVYFICRLLLTHPHAQLINNNNDEKISFTRTAKHFPHSTPSLSTFHSALSFFFLFLFGFINFFFLFFFSCLVDVVVGGGGGSKIWIDRKLKQMLTKY